MNDTDQTVSIKNGPCADPESFARRGSTFNFFDKKKVDPNSTKSGPSLVHQRNAIWMSFRWRADDRSTLNAGLSAL